MTVPVPPRVTGTVRPRGRVAALLAAIAVVPCMLVGFHWSRVAPEHGAEPHVVASIAPAGDQAMAGEPASDSVRSRTVTADLAGVLVAASALVVVASGLVGMGSTRAAGGGRFERYEARAPPRALLALSH